MTGCFDAKFRNKALKLSDFQERAFWGKTGQKVAISGLFSPFFGGLCLLLRQ
jgi:hypothetical protein